MKILSKREGSQLQFPHIFCLASRQKHSVQLQVTFSFCFFKLHRLSPSQPFYPFPISYGNQQSSTRRIRLQHHLIDAEMSWIHRSIQSSKHPARYLVHVQVAQHIFIDHPFCRSSSILSDETGSIWSAVPRGSTKPVIIKVTNKTLVRHGLGVANGRQWEVQENIFKERAILKYLSSAKRPCKSIVKYIEWFEDDLNYFLVEQHGGFPLFDFVEKAHAFIGIGKLSISEWHKMVQRLFKQMVDAVDFMHRHRVAHFDISLENMLIPNIDVMIDNTEQMHFVLDDVQLKICDFGLVDIFKSKIATESGPKISFISTKKAGKTLYKSPEMLTGKRCDAVKNDIWCLGVTLFMMLIGACPFSRASNDDETFRKMMNGEMMKMLQLWKRDSYVTEDMVDLLQSILQYEVSRISLSDLKQHQWMNKAL